MFEFIIEVISYVLWYYGEVSHLKKPFGSSKKYFLIPDLEHECIQNYPFLRSSNKAQQNIMRLQNQFSDFITLIENYILVGVYKGIFAICELLDLTLERTNG